MKKSTLLAIFGIGVAVASYVYNAANTGDYSPTSYIEWISSLWTQITLQAESAVGTDYVTEATKLVAGFEGFRATAYPDPAGQTKTYSIGYGHQIISGDGLTTTSKISESDAFSLLESDIASAVACVENAVDTTQLSTDQTAALISLCYNIGCGAFGGSTLVKDINNGDLASAVAQFLAWNHAGGIVSDVLTSRRQSESNLFSSGIVDTSTNDTGGIDV